MTTKLCEVLERGLVGLLVSSFFLPLLLVGWLYSPKRAAGVSSWIRNTTLTGIQVRPENVFPTKESILSATYQRAWAGNFDRTFPARELFIRGINEVYLRVLHVSPIGFLIGPNLALFEHEYPEEYCLRRPADRQALQPLVDDLKRFQTACEARKIPFDLLITPNKASIYPEWLPTGWLWRYKPGERYYEALVALLKDSGVHYVDGHTLTAGMKSGAKTPVFPLGGMHWGDPAVLTATNAVLADLAAQGLGVQPIRDFTATASDNPTGQDADVAGALNIVNKLRYPVVTVAVRPVEKPGLNRPNMVVVGGSFMFKMLDMLGGSHDFSEIDYYFYHRTGHFLKTDSAMTLVSEPAGPIDYATDIFAADAILLEANEETMPEGPRHLTSFLHDALAALPEPNVAKPPFHYFSKTAYQWGQVISLYPPGAPEEAASQEQIVHVNTLGGFEPPGNGGSWTVGAEASIYFRAPAPVGDMVLDIDALPFTAPPALTEQRARVGINGQPAGEVVFRGQSTTRQTLTVPRALLGDGGELIELHLARPGSPAEFGINSDQRLLGLLIARVSLHLPAGANVYQWGETLSFDTADPVALRARMTQCCTSDGFSPPGNGGAFTVGEVATLDVPTPAVTQDMMLDVAALPFTAPPRLTEQRVKITVNGEPIGETLWTLPSTITQSFRIPAHLLAKSGARVEFHIAHPGSPAEFGQGQDTRKLGILVARVSFHAAE